MTEKDWLYVSTKIKEKIAAEYRSITQFADTHNLDRVNLSKFLSGRRRDIKLSTLYKIANAFEINIRELVG